MDAECDFGTRRSLTTISPEPVPQRPLTFQESISSTLSRGKMIMRELSAPLASFFGAPSAMIAEPPISQSQLAEPDAHCHLPLTT